MGAMKTLLAMAVAPALIGAAPAASDNRAIVTDFARLFYMEKDVRAAFDRHVAPDYIQHNPGIADGRDAAVAALAPKFSSPGARFEIQRILVDGDMAVIHLRARLTPDSRGLAVVDMYRIKGGRIVEHWDVLQPVPEHSANPHPMF